jgi:hypothetical protein
MKLSEFVLTHSKETRPGYHDYFANVTVTTGALWWKRIERKAIWRSTATCWSFVDTGEFTPGLQAEFLERSYIGREKLSKL